MKAIPLSRYLPYYVMAMLLSLLPPTTAKAQFSVSPAGVIAHRQGLTISEINVQGLGKLYRDPNYAALHRYRTYGNYPLVRTPRGRTIVFFQALYAKTIAGYADPTTLQLGTLMGGSHGTASMLSVLTTDPIRKLLEIDKKQEKEIQRIADDFQKAIAGRMNEFQRANPTATPEETGLARLGEAERLSVTLREMLEKTLTPQQMQYTREAVFILYGGLDSPVVDLEILSLFNLTKEQRERLEEVAEDANKKRANITTGHRLRDFSQADFERIDKHLKTIAAVNARKIKAILTPEQRKLAEHLEKQEEQLLKEFAKGMP